MQHFSEQRHYGGAMTRTIADLRWKILSPSFYRLDHGPTQGQVDIDFLGDRWYLFVTKDGHVTSLGFDSRDAAIATVVCAFGRT